MYLRPNASRLGAIIVAMLMFALLASGCARTGPEKAPTASTEGQPAEIVVSLGGEPEAGFDPIFGWGRDGSPLFQSTLLARNDDLGIVNDLATGHEVSEDGLTWTVTIRDDVTFHDGEPLTAHDVAFTFNTAKESGSIVDLGVMESAEATDDTTVVFTLSEPRSTFVVQLISLGIVPRHAYGPEYALSPIGSGPYRFVEWSPGQQLIVEAYADYHGGAVEIQRITFLFMDEDATLAAARAGELDVAAVPAAFASQDIAGMRLIPVPSVDNRGIMFPFLPDEGETTGDGAPIGNDVTSDVAIRRAINLAVDRDALVEGVLEGFGFPAFSVSDGLPWSNPAVVFEDGDLEGAKALLDEAGWIKGLGYTVREKNGLEARFELIYPADDIIRQSLALAVADQIRQIGIEMTPVGKSWDEIRMAMHSDAVLFGWGSHDPIEMYNLHHGTLSGMEWWNPGFYKNPVVDAYMDQALAAIDEEEALGLWRKAQWDGATGISGLADAPWCWLVNLDHCFFVADRLDIGDSRIQPHGHGWPITANITDWRLE
ncbi:MAG: ABC transporter substrate-binding protein [Actinobacteria bacterium]|nr:ABC transporter substrate-binding protein [Actinomycetota bacterium]